jgi:hypothetical protein
MRGAGHRRRALALVALSAGLVALSGAGVSRATPAETCTDSGPLVCVSVTGTPDSVLPSTAASDRFVSYSTVVTNRDSRTVTHVTVRESLTGGLTLDSISTTLGSCSAGSTGATCVIGNLASEASVTISLVARSPENEGTASLSSEASFDETSNDNPDKDPKQDTVSATAQTTVEAVAGSAASFVPAGSSVELSTDPTESGTANLGDPLIARADITNSPTDVTALIEEVAAPVACPRRVICRGGDWVHANIPGTFDPPLSFGFRWDKSLIPSALNAKKFSILYTECLGGCPVQVISAVCSSASPPASELPCLSGVAKLPDGDWVGTLLNTHNGYMK